MKGRKSKKTKEKDYSNSVGLSHLLKAIQAHNKRGIQLEQMLGDIMLRNNGGYTQVPDAFFKKFEEHCQHIKKHRGSKSFDEAWYAEFSANNLKKLFNVAVIPYDLLDGNIDKYRPKQDGN